jgi:LAO/AO transport system kinase
MNGLQEKMDQLVARLLSGDTASLARAITLVESTSEAGRVIHQMVRPNTGNARVLGITGPPGSGKSTLISAYVAAMRKQDRRVAVIAVDPSSPLSGGAVLGDRVRMGRHTNDPYVYIRSISARGHLGGLSASIHAVIDVVDAAGWDTIILETVGAGQSETEVAEIADVNVVINAPGSGDDVQAIKAGILEIADVLVVNKADSPLAVHTERQLQAMLHLRSSESPVVAVVKTIATEDGGIEDLLRVVDDLFATKLAEGKKGRLLRRIRRLLAREASEKIKRLILHGEDQKIEQICEAVAAGDSNYHSAVDMLLREYCAGHGAIVGD